MVKTWCRRVWSCIIDHHWSSLVIHSGDSSRIDIQYYTVYPNESTEWPSLSCMTVWLSREIHLMGLRTIPPDAWEFDSRIPECGKLAARTLRSARSIREHSPTWSNMQSAFHQGSLVNWYSMCDFAKWIEMQTKKRFLPPSDINESIPGHSQRFLRTSVFRN